MRRRKQLAALAGLAVMLTAWAAVLMARADPVTRETFDLIQEGMNRREVEAILGPPKDYRTGPTTSVHIVEYYPPCAGALRLKPESPSVHFSKTDWDDPFPPFDPITGKPLGGEMWK